MDKAHVQIGSIGPGFESCLEAAFFPPRRFSAGPTKSCEIVNFVFRQEIKQLASSLDCSSSSRNLACGFFRARLIPTCPQAVPRTRGSCGHLYPV